MTTLYDLQPNSVPGTQDQHICVLGVNILNVTKQRAVDLLENAIRNYDQSPKSVFHVNAHTLNLACADQQYQAVLNSGDFVFGDGTGVRWAAKLQGLQIADNLVGTDFVPFLMKSTAGRGYSFFLLGSDEQTIASAAGYAQNMFPGWTLCGYHHGYLNTPRMNSAAIEKINDSQPDVLLVGMGNPIQEQWISQNRQQLEVPLCMGIGGLFDYWAGNVSRAHPGSAASATSGFGDYSNNLGKR